MLTVSVSHIASSFYFSFIIFLLVRFVYLSSSTSSSSSSSSSLLLLLPLIFTFYLSFSLILSPFLYFFISYSLSFFPSFSLFLSFFLLFRPLFFLFIFLSLILFFFLPFSFLFCPSLPFIKLFYSSSTQSGFHYFFILFSNPFVFRCCLSIATLFLEMMKTSMISPDSRVVYKSFLVVIFQSMSRNHSSYIEICHLHRLNLCFVIMSSSTWYKSGKTIWFVNTPTIKLAFKSVWLQAHSVNGTDIILALLSWPSFMKRKTHYWWVTEAKTSIRMRLVQLPHPII